MLVIGIPLGVLTGRVGWNTVGGAATSSCRCPRHRSSRIAVAALGLVVFATLVALVPARLSVRRTVGLTLRAE